MQRKRFVLPLAGLLALSLAAAAGAQTVVKRGPNLVEVTVLGQGLDEEEAVRDGLRKAVERAAGTFIYSHSKAEDFALVKDTILTRSAGFVHSRKVVSKNKTLDGVWEVKLKVVVSVKGVEDMWGVVTNLLKEMGRPKVMVFIRERIRGRRVELSTVQTRIEALLLKSGFKLVDKKQIRAIDDKDLVAAMDSDNTARFQAIAKRFGAQLFITGTANATPGVTKSIGGVIFHTYEAEANVRCYRSDTGQMLSAIPGAATRGVQRVWRSAAKQALDQQAKRVAPRVRMDILRFWQDALAGRGEVKLLIDGVSFKQYMQLKRDLKKIKEVKDVTAKYHNKQAECSLQSSLRAEPLAEKIAEAFKNLEITDVSQNVIKAKFAE